MNTKMTPEARFSYLPKTLGVCMKYSTVQQRLKLRIFSLIFTFSKSHSLNLYLSTLFPSLVFITLLVLVLS